jgi:hypothetical protein
MHWLDNSNLLLKKTSFARISSLSMYPSYSEGKKHLPNDRLILKTDLLAHVCK